MPRATPPSVDDYLEGIENPASRAALDRLRAIIQSEIPEAHECISYGIPTYKHNGFVVGIAAFKNHCSLFPGHTVADFTDRLKGFKVSKGTIQFHPDRPLPEDLVRDIVRTRFSENEVGAAG